MIRRALAVIGGLGILAMLGYALQALDQPIRKIVVSGEPTQEERARIQASMAQVQLRGILSTDLADVEDQLRELGWTRQVMVRRQWPDRLEVRLRKAVPVAKWGARDYLTVSGEPLQLPNDYPDLPALSAHISSPAQTMELYRLLQLFAARQGLSIAMLAESPQGEWEVGFQGGLTLRLGSTGVNERMRRFLRAYALTLKTQPRKIEYVDARYTNGIAVRFGLPVENSSDV